MNVVPERESSTVRRSLLRRRLRLRELLRPQRPSVPVTTAGAFGVSLVAAFYAPDASTGGSGPHLLYWMTANVAGALCTIGVVAFFTWMMKTLDFDRPNALLASIVYGSYLVAGLLASIWRIVVESAFEGVPVHHRIDLLFLGGAASFTLVGVAANAYLALRTQVIAQDTLLRHQLAELERSRMLLARADEQVRRDVAEILHGLVQSRLLAAQMRLEMAVGLVTTSPDRAVSEIKAAAVVLDDVRANDVRAASHQLHPPAIRVGLLVALRSLIARFEGEFGLEVDFEVGPGVAALDDPTGVVLDEGMRLVMYRSLDAALGNAHRHGGATHARVDLHLMEGPSLQLLVTDNGRGLSDQPEMGLGLGGVAARVEHRRGSWALSPTPEGGARLTVTVPFRGDDVGGGLPAPGPRRGRRGVDVLPHPNPPPELRAAVGH